MSDSAIEEAVDRPLTVNIIRTVAAGHEAAFEEHLRAFIPVALSFTGHLGVHVLKPEPGTTREYRVVLRFASRPQWQAFQAWAPYVQFRETITPLLEREPCIEELTGLESWLTLPGAQSIRPIPRWKMASVTFLGVYPVSLLLAWALSPLLHTWPLWLRGLVTAACMVATLTWIVMPLLTRALHRWLYPAPDAR